jgi:hypothetical protein
MKLEITERCLVVCEPGSIVEVSESQALTLGDFSKEVKDEAPVKKKTSKKSED